MNATRTSLAICSIVVAAIMVPRFAAADDKTEAVKIEDITLTVPNAWKKQPPSNRLRLAQFEIPASEGDAEPGELVVSSFGGTGGGVQANVDRWIGQFENQGRQAKITHGESPQGKYVVVDLTGTYKKPDGPPFLRKTKPVPGSRMLAVILQVEGKGFYFLKLTGLKKTVTDAAGPLRQSFAADAEKEKPLEFEQ